MFSSDERVFRLGPIIFSAGLALAATVKWEFRKLKSRGSSLNLARLVNRRWQNWAQFSLFQKLYCCARWNSKYKGPEWEGWGLAVRCLRRLGWRGRCWPCSGCCRCGSTLFVVLPSLTLFAGPSRWPVDWRGWWYEVGAILLAAGPGVSLVVGFQNRQRRTSVYTAVRCQTTNDPCSVPTSGFFVSPRFSSMQD